MKNAELIRIALTAVGASLAVLAGGTKLAAQEHQTKHSHYKVIDVGTLGGPHSQFNFFSRVLNQQGTAVGGASTPIPDPACSFDSPYCFVFHAIQYKNNELIDLGSLPGGANSFAAAINSRGPDRRSLGGH